MTRHQCCCGKQPELLIGRVDLCSTAKNWVCLLRVCAASAVKVREEQAEAQAVAAVVSAEEAEVAAQAAKCKALKDDALADLVRIHLSNLAGRC